MRCIAVKCVKFSGKLSTFWLNQYPKVKSVKVLGKLSTFWLKYHPKVKCVKFSGKLSTFWLNIENTYLSLSSSNIIFFIPIGVNLLIMNYN